MDRECLERKLNFHAPLLSTRRPGRIIVPRKKWDVDSSSGFNDRVPFSWEQSPGKPKEILIRSRRIEENTNTSNLSFLLPLKPPPIRLHPHSRLSKDSSSKQEADDEEEEDDDGDDDDGCDGYVDDNDEDRDFFCGGLDLFSLAESSENGNGIATGKKSRRVAGKAGGGGRRRAPPTPSYIMERFLPAAVALAATSSSYFTMEARGKASSGLGFRDYESDSPPAAAQVCTPPPRNRMVGGRRVLPSVTSSPILAFKTCGLHNLLPWQPRPKKSSIRGPFRFGCSDWKPQLSPTLKYRS